VTRTCVHSRSYIYIYIYSAPYMHSCSACVVSVCDVVSTRSQTACGDSDIATSTIPRCCIFTRADGDRIDIEDSELLRHRRRPHRTTVRECLSCMPVTLYEMLRACVCMCVWFGYRIATMMGHTVIFDRINRLSCARKVDSETGGMFLTMQPEVRIQDGGMVSV